MFGSVGNKKKTVGDFQVQPQPDSLVLTNTPIPHTKSDLMTEAWDFLPSYICLKGMCVYLKPGLHVWECGE